MIHQTIKRTALVIALLAPINMSAYSNESPAQRDADGLTPLHLAAGRGDSSEILRLLNEGQDLFTLDSKFGVSVLHKAVYSGNADAVTLLLKHGALINLQSPSNGNTPLHDALYFKRGNDLSVIKTLLDNGASLNISNRAGLQPIQSAHLLKDSDAERILSEAEKRRHTPNGVALMSAVKENDLAKVTELLKNKNINLAETDENGFAPLAWAAREGYSSIVDLLIKAGANVNQNDQWMGATAGHKAAFWGRTEAMELLIKHGLNLDARGSYNGYTALMDAITRNHNAVAKLLIEAGARIDIRGHDNLTAIDIAKMNKNDELLRLLQSAKN